ncbi:hypothetical protein D3C71_1599480 [compost metagenome]
MCQPGGWVHIARGADHQHHIAALGGILRLLQLGMRQALAKPDHGRAQVVAAAGALGRAVILGKAHVAAGPGWKQPAAVHQVAVQAQNRAAACALVQSVHVLRHQSDALGVLRLPLRQCEMARIGLHIGHQPAAVLVPVPHPLRMGQVARFTRHLFGAELRPETRLRITKSGHARLGTHACARQYQQVACIRNPLSHLSDVGGWLQGSRARGSRHAGKR